MKKFNLVKFLFITIIISFLLGVNSIVGLASPDNNFNDNAHR